MRVFVVSEGYAYEGESIVKVFDSEEKAIRYIYEKYPLWDHNTTWVDKRSFKYCDIKAMEVE